MKKSYLLTGVTGLIGRHLLYELLLQPTTAHIYVLIRQREHLSAYEVIEQLLIDDYAITAIKELSSTALMQKITPIVVDLKDAQLTTILPMHIPSTQRLCVIHSANSVNLFTTEQVEQEIYETNYLGTLRLFETLQPQLDTFIFISTAFANGLQDGLIKDEFLFDIKDDVEYRNPYEKYKTLTEQMLHDKCQAANIDLQILRPSVVCGRLYDAPLYVMTKFDVIYGWARFFWALREQGQHEHIRILVTEQATLNVIPVDYVSKAIVRAAHSPHIQQLNIAHTHSASIRGMMVHILDVLNYTNYEFVNELPTQQNRTEKLYYRLIEMIFGLYIGGVSTQFDTTTLRQLMHDIEEEDIVQHMPQLMAFAAQCDFNI